MPIDPPPSPAAAPSPSADGAATVRAALFAGVAEAAGTRGLVVPWSGGTVADLRRALERACPAAAALLARSAIALGSRYARDDDPVAAGDDVAVIPPVSGG